jgi:glycosyltransferase involved in cell wall biosynthesis
MVVVSVIVPAYNAARSLPTTLASARNQSLQDIEILVVDDASQDQTYEIGMSVARADPRVRMIRRTTNGGPSAARNTALDAAQGTWIALLDADDLYLSQRLSVLADTARSADGDLVADNMMLLCPESGRCLGLAIPPVVANSRRLWTAADFARNDRPFPSDFRQFGYLKPLIRRSFLEVHQIRYDADLWVAEDFVLYMRCLLAGARMMLLPDAYYQYVLSRGSTSRSPDHVARRYEHLAIGNARILAQARRQGDRATFVQVKRRGKNIGFLRAHHGFKDAARRRRWAEALAHLIRMALAPIEFARLLHLFIGRRVFPANRGQHLTDRPGPPQGGSRSRRTLLQSFHRSKG